MQVDKCSDIAKYTDSHRRFSRPEKISAEGWEKLPVYSIDLQTNKLIQKTNNYKVNWIEGT